MQQFNPTQFLAALRETMKSGIAAVALSEAEVFFIANSNLQRPDRLSYAIYKEFAEAYEANNYRLPDLPNAEMLEHVYMFVNSEKAKQKLELLNKVKEGGKDYRRFCWILERQEKQQRAEAAQTREKAKEKREKEKATLAAEKAEKVSTTSPPMNAAPPQSQAPPMAAAA